MAARKKHRGKHSPEFYIKKEQEFSPNWKDYLFDDELMGQIVANIKSAGKVKNQPHVRTAH